MLHGKKCKLYLNYIQININLIYIDIFLDPKKILGPWAIPRFALANRWSCH